MVGSGRGAAKWCSAVVRSGAGAGRAHGTSVASARARWGGPDVPGARAPSSAPPHAGPRAPPCGDWSHRVSPSHICNICDNN